MIHCTHCDKQTDITIDGLCADCMRTKSINDPSIEKWIVFWMNGARIGSIELNDKNMAEVNRSFHYTLIQTDITGTIHLSINGVLTRAITPDFTNQLKGLSNE